MRLAHVPLAGLVLLIASPGALGAQARPPAARETTPAVPREMRPPPGKCRIWISGVPAKQQPAPTDCATALRQTPAKGVVLYGPAKAGDDQRFDRKSGADPLAPSAVPRSGQEQRGVRPTEKPAEKASDKASGTSAGSSAERPDEKRGEKVEPDPAAKREAKPVPVKKPVEPVKKKPERT